uniref:Uncharacterized protein n=3 Tax=Peptoclostridium acidaminophilum TaxID=1731 RepID=Q8GCS5_PEPAC|nr:unknown [Peptoclostridium acidaminophilum]
MTFGVSGAIYLIVMIIAYKIFNKTKPDAQLHEDINTRTTQ